METCKIGLVSVSIDTDDIFHLYLGEIFDKNALTAAHQTLPLASIIEVTNLENGKKVKLRVNDRGPFAKDRILDVSRKAADILEEAQNWIEQQMQLISDESRWNR